MTRDAERDHPRVTVATVTIAHHAAHSGYARIAPLIAAASPGVELLGPRPLPRRLPRRVATGLTAAARPLWYREEALAIELAVARRMLARRTDVVHLMYGEPQFWYSGWAARAAAGRTRLLCTFHQPPDVLAQVGPGVRRLRQLDGAIVFSEEQAAYLAGVMGADRVFRVGNGIDMQWWCPDTTVRDDATCLIVGQWLRDTAVISDVVADLGRRAPHVRLRLAGIAPGLAVELADAPNATILPRLDDEQLRREYRAATLVLLPLRDSTVNCALMESLGCGTPVVVTDVGGVRCHVDDSCAVLTAPGDAVAAADHVLALLADPQRRARLARGARTRALRFDASDVAARLVEVYRTLATS